VGLQTNTSVSADTQRLCDAYGRCLNNLRVSVTQRCDLNCFFCHREGEDAAGKEMTPTEIAAIVQMACRLGMTKVKITGGEPLLREDIVDIVARIAQHAEEVSLTTNGFLLEEKAGALRDAGLHRVNVSLHALTPAAFKKITGRSGLHRVQRGIVAALTHHLDPVKVNMVVLQGLNDHEIQPMIDFTAHGGAILQLIEFQPVHHENWTPWARYHSDLSAVEGWLAERAFKIQKRPMHHRKQYYLQRDSGVACVEIVKPMHNSEFCRNCTRLRVTSDGKLKPCLLRNDNLVDAVTYVRGRQDWAGLEQAFRRVVTLREPYWKDVDAEKNHAT
jgi:cyclic pyranopterin phosphate synthase